MNGHIKAKVTPKFDYNRSRPSSPIKTLPTNPSPTPGARPRAKVNSSANVTVRKPVALASTHNLNATTSTTTTARAPPGRAPSPFKPTQGRTLNSPGVASQVKAKVAGAARTNVVPAASAPSLPELRQRALTASSDATARTRRGSISSHVSSSAGFVPSRNLYSPPKLTLNSSNEENHSGSSSVVSANGGAIKVRSKVSRLAETDAQLSLSVPPSPSFPPHTRPTRVPSVSNLSLSPPLGPARSAVHSPMSSPAHGRFAPTRDAASPKANSFRAFAPLDDTTVAYSSSPHARVDPAQIPLPPQSPQMSAVSFSSRSSASCGSRGSDTSGSTAPTLHHRFSGVNGKHARSKSSVDGLSMLHSPHALSREPSKDEPSPALEGEDAKDTSDEADGQVEDDVRKLRKEAISNRKIADLEITNKSLMAINLSLEAAKNRQAREIRDLRRKLRESILVLPPSAFHAAKTSLSPEEAVDVEEEEEEEDDDEAQAAIEGTTDEAYRRVRSMLEVLIDSGRKALETKPEDFRTSGVGITKVLSEEEARTWRGEDLSFTERDYTDDGVADDDPSRPLTPSRVAIPDDPSSEEEDDGSIVMDNDILNMPSVPPITVTPSPSP
ncbi:hypothetical protein PHLGIDRAFT_114795 [Phlebiopsis gigantea 11061_1 CR5-6]|uniref:Uncharacterized protein n=1 Tax=Phlebiopsis gigantea (strain 11061_1 CR5-6) TaxID=745531 RepID=A0A0C3SEY2_PHLG1|nr:hypothetical protein PHLGIDRAFT_114795 [Phlebiopsis gigantea 11061_1 CR5-6]